MVHPRLYWGEAGNDLTPALLELPISRNYQHGGWDKPHAVLRGRRRVRSAPAGPTTSSIRTAGGGACTSSPRGGSCCPASCTCWPASSAATSARTSGRRRRELAPRLVWRDVVDHLRLRIPPASGGPQYGLLQKCAYSFVVFVAAPLMALTGLAMSPAVTAAFPFLLRLFGGYQSARTIHFFTFAALVLFVFVHVVMVVKSGFRRQMRAMTVGE